MHCLAGLDTLTSGSRCCSATSTSEPVRHRPHQGPPRSGSASSSSRSTSSRRSPPPRTSPCPMSLAGARADQGVGRPGHRARSGSATASTTGRSELSGGQQQRVAVARALASRPHARLRRRADRQPRQPRRRRGARPAPLRPVDRLGQTVVMVTHDPAGGRLGRPTPCSSPTAASSTASTAPPPKARARAHEAPRVLRRPTVLQHHPLAAWSRKRRLVGTALAIVLGVAFLAATLVLGDTARAGFQPRLRRGQRRRPTPACASDSQRFDGRRDALTYRRSPPAAVDVVAAVDGVAATVPDRRGHRPGARRRRQADRRRRSPTIGATWIDDPDLTGWDARRRARPRCAGEVVIDRGHRRGGRPRRRRHQATILVPGPRHRDRRRHRRLRRQGQHRRHHVRRLHARRGRSSSCSGRPTCVTGVAVRAVDGVSQARAR